MIEWFDNHCHLSENIEEEILKARKALVVGFINVGTDFETSCEAIEKARMLPDVWATAGVHPHEAKKGIEGIEDLLGDPNVVAVGEAGLDYHYDYSPREDQRKVFAEQIEMANKSNLPLVIHTREAWEETFEILDSEGVPKSTVFHCFTGGPIEAKECLERGAYLSFSGIITFKRSESLREAASECPLDRAMIETDSPYLTPVPFRGKKNEPANVGLIGKELAYLQDKSSEEIALATTQNALDFYGLR
ncbi:MAG: TatD family hydrolase [Acidimicrobiales bacterium]|jgi:TatD DNase family protein|nr:hydrolase TatD [Acidimicrobiaceae bacterium]MDP6162264.1 TatD family hydrolase [Acidimicrobiales bacterium]MDP6285332.1 TatD family hydrolase [Acidimicrobiales bacterium]HJL90810.1 TatD family hydrolase [Acidimicrobiales bacterium]HJO41237.1 TatD family hydrolase [Acidimicrobiales bacterium]|tara:strand:- start:1125 stop:1868 length:744 start_codon:yes stop_codon:yes gene_type:complete